MEKIYVIDSYIEANKVSLNSKITYNGKPYKVVSNIPIDLFIREIREDGLVEMDKIWELVIMEMDNG
jgi:hypothetical protein